MLVGKTLLEVRALAVVHWSDDGWRIPRDAETSETGPGMHVADLPTAGPRAGATID